MSSVLDEVLEIEPSPRIVSVMAGTRPGVVLGIDVGTSGVRAALFDERGEEVRGAHAENVRVSMYSGFDKIDAESAVQLVSQTIDDVLATPEAAGSTVELLSLSCFWHGLMGVDSEGRPTTPIFGWADTRSVKATTELRVRLDEQKVHARTGCRFHPSYWPAKLLWLREERPEIFKNSRHWLGFAEYLTLRLFGETATGISMASATGLFNQHTRNWDDELIQELDIQAETLPLIAFPNKAFNQLLPEYSLRWPQLSDAHLYPAIGDGAANNIGASCHSRNKLALMIGTSGALRTLYEGEPPSVLPDALWCYRADRTRVVVGGALSDGGGLYRWLADSLSFSHDADLQGMLAQMEPDAHGLTVLPFWAGERSTGWAPNARGTILGLSVHTKPVDIIRAAMEAIAYRFAFILNALEPITPGALIVASGNALRSSPLWVQILSDVLNRPLSLIAIAEASMRGAALLALEGAGKIRDIQEFSVPVERIFEPDAGRHALYKAGLERHQHYYEQVVKGSG